MTGITKDEFDDDLKQFIEITEEGSALIPPLVQQEKWNRAFNESTLYAYPIADGLWDNLSPGVYSIAIEVPQALKNKGIYPYGLLIVRGAKTGGLIQVYFPHNSSAYVIRTGGWNSAWNSWSIIPSEVELKHLPFTYVTLLAGFTGTIRYGKDYMNNVTLDIDLTNTPTNTPLTVIGVLPAGFRPEWQTPILLNHSNSNPYGGYATLFIDISGNITVSYDNKIIANAINPGLRGTILYKATR